MQFPHHSAACPQPGPAQRNPAAVALLALAALATPQPASAFVDDPLDRFAQISAGNEHSCGVTHRGEAWCWGRNAIGQLGDGSSLPRLLPVRVSTAAEGFDRDNIAMISAGTDHTCAVTTSGQAFCWGSNSNGQLGTGDTTFGYALSPQPVDTTQPGFGAENIAMIASGGAHTCALTINGRAWCWGDNNSAQLGTGDTSYWVAASPQPVDTTQPGFGARNITSITTGGEHSCALNSAGRAFCWGGNNEGQIGDGTLVASRKLPAPVATAGIWGFGPRNIAAISAGSSNTCAVTTEGRSFCWGANTAGSLGDGTRVTRRLVPTPVDTRTPGYGAKNIAAVSASGSHSCALSLSGRAFCWGANDGGQVGEASNTSPLDHPRRVNTTAPGFRQNNIVQILAGGGHSCALNAAGRPYCWGYNASGQLGLGDTTNRNRPFPVAFDPSPPPPAD